MGGCCSIYNPYIVIVNFRYISICLYRCRKSSDKTIFYFLLGHFPILHLHYFFLSMTRDKDFALAIFWQVTNFFRIEIDPIYWRHYTIKIRFLILNIVTQNVLKLRFTFNFRKHSRHTLHLLERTSPEWKYLLRNFVRVLSNSCLPPATSTFLILVRTIF